MRFIIVACSSPVVAAGRTRIAVTNTVNEVDNLTQTVEIQ